MPHKLNHARRHKFDKAEYQVRNWPSYDAALRRRGQVRLWISEEAISLQVLNKMAEAGMPATVRVT